VTTSQWLFVALVAVVSLERLAELVVSKRHARWAFTRGGTEYGGGHYPFMVALHSCLLVACVSEVVGYHRPFVAVLGWAMLALVAASQALRWWCIATLGKRWNTRVIIVPGAPLVTAGPYRWWRHPNYAAVVVEGVALPLVHSAWLTALGFTLLNTALLAVRIQVENQALAVGLRAPQPS
jgi:methyltransferase